MRNTIEKASEIVQKFANNFWIEIEKDPETKSEIDNYIFKNTVLKKIYNGMQFGDYLISKYTKEYVPIPKDTKKLSLDWILEKSFRIPQFYGGIRENTVKLGIKVFDDYSNICMVEDVLIPQMLIKMFKFEDIDNAVPEVDQTFKQLKTYIFDEENDWKNKEILLDDIRCVETEYVGVKNLKKTIRTGFELSVILTGKHKNNLKESRGLKKVFNCNIEFSKDGNEWIATSFSFNPY